MATLTAIEIRRIRDMIGDSKPSTQPDSTTGYDLTDVMIQAEWDTADGHDSDANQYKALYNMLRRRRGIWLNQTDTHTEQGSTLQNQKLKNIERALLEYQNLAGIGGFILGSRSGVLDFGIDENEPSES